MTVRDVSKHHSVGRNLHPNRYNTRGLNLQSILHSHLIEFNFNMKILAQIICRYPILFLIYIGIKMPKV